MMLYTKRMGRRSRLRKLKKLQQRQQIHQTSSAVNQLPFNLNLISYIAYALAIAALLYLAFTVIKPGFFPSGHDIGPHYGRSKVFVQALSQGQFPVRWVDWIQEGTGHPMFNFYQVGFYYLVALVNKVVPSLNYSVQTTVVISWWLGALFMFLLMRKFGNLPGIVSAVIFAYTPYIISDVFVRAAYPELTAIAFSIGALWALDRIVTLSKAIYALPLSVCLFFVFTSHLPTLVIIFPLLIGYTFLLFVNKESKGTGLMLAFAALVLAIGLSSFYIIPALTEIKYIKSDLLTSGYYDFHPHFVYLKQLFSTFWDWGKSVEGDQDGMSFQFGLVHWAIIIISIVTYFFIKKNKFKNYIVFWLVFILYATFFMHEISVSFWESLKPITFVQYPWRFLMIVAICCAGLSALLTASLTSKLYQMMAVFSSVLLVFVFYFSYLKPSVYIPNDFFNIDSNNWRESKGIILNPPFEEGYFPTDVQEIPTGIVGRWSLMKNDDQKDFPVKIEPKIIKDYQIQLLIDSPKPIGLILHIFYFPGWKIWVNNQQVQINHDNKYQFMVVSLPVGISKVEAKFTDTTIRKIANSVSLLSFIVLICWQVYLFRRIKII